MEGKAEYAFTCFVRIQCVGTAVSMATNTLCTCILLWESECLQFERGSVVYVRGCDLVTGHSLCACLRVHSSYFDVVDDRVVYSMFKYRHCLSH